MAREGRGNKSRGNFKSETDLEQRIIDLARVTRVMAGGKRMRFRACVALGDKKGRIGWGIAKGADVTIAVNKAATKARKRLVKVDFVKQTIPHEVLAKFKAAKVLLKPARPGTGVIAGGAVRVVLELLGIPNIYGKILSRSTNKVNNVQAVFKALQSLKRAVKIERAEESLEEKRLERDLDKEEELEKTQAKLLSKEKDLDNLIKK